MIWYIHIELLPRLSRMRKGYKLIPNSESTIVIEGQSLKFKGETDKDGKACGKGVLEYG